MCTPTSGGTSLRGSLVRRSRCSCSTRIASLSTRSRVWIPPRSSGSSVNSLGRSSHRRTLSRTQTYSPSGRKGSTRAAASANGRPSRRPSIFGAISTPTPLRSTPRRPMPSLLHLTSLAVSPCTPKTSRRGSRTGLLTRSSGRFVQVTKTVSLTSGRGCRSRKRRTRNKRPRRTLRTRRKRRRRRRRRRRQRLPRKQKQRRKRRRPKRQGGMKPVGRRLRRARRLRRQQAARPRLRARRRRAKNRRKPPPRPPPRGRRRRRHRRRHPLPKHLRRPRGVTMMTTTTVRARALRRAPAQRHRNRRRLKELRRHPRPRREVGRLHQRRRLPPRIPLRKRRRRKEGTPVGARRLRRKQRPRKAVGNDTAEQGANRTTHYVAPPLYPRPA
eukprot:Hpha_TRINITY_DN15858_c1_g4::TRINITY_DN15858_c1_g4_i6::g.190562::m.190562